MTSDNSTCFVEFFGDFIPYPWIDLSEPPNFYNLFVDRCALLGSSTGSLTARPLLWGLNDGSREWTPAEGLLAWVQVDLGKALSIGGLPLLALVEAGWSALERMGQARLNALRTLLPLRDHQPAPSYSSVGWFQYVDPTAHTTARVELNASTQDVHVNADRILARATERACPPFQNIRLLPPSQAPLARRRPIFSPIWGEYDARPVSFEIDLPESSATALAWVVEFFAGVLREAGVRTTVVASAEF